MMDIDCVNKYMTAQRNQPQYKYDSGVDRSTNYPQRNCEQQRPNYRLAAAEDCNRSDRDRSRIELRRSDSEVYLYDGTSCSQYYQNMHISEIEFLVNDIDIDRRLDAYLDASIGWKYYPRILITTNLIMMK